MQQLLQKNDEAYRQAVQSGRIFDLFMIAADDKELADGAALLRKDGSPEARSLFGSLVESHGSTGRLLRNTRTLAGASV